MLQVVFRKHLYSLLTIFLLTFVDPSFSLISSLTRRHRSMDTKQLQSHSEEHSQPLLPHEADGVIFDIDGTLADSWKLGFDATQVVLKNQNIPLITEELYHECTKYCTPDRMARHAGLLPDQDKEFSAVGKRLGDEFDELYVGLVSLETAGFYDGIEELILGLQSNGDVKLAALTNACVEYAYAVLKINCPLLSRGDEGKGIYEKFISIHGADTVAKPKPYPDGLFLCCEEIGISPEKCVYIGDSPSDAVAAKSAGMVAIGVLWGSHPLESLKNAPFDYLCKSVDDLKILLVKNDVPQASE